MKASLVIFSGLPGTGKTSLANPVATHLRWPLLRIDDIVGFIPQAMLDHAHPYWETLISIMLHIAEAQLEIGVSVVIDSVFMGDDRLQAQQTANRNDAQFLPIYTYISDETIWRDRVERRVAKANPDDGVATWERIQEQRKSFQSWNEGDALFVDSLDPLEKNLAQVMAYVTENRG